MHAKRRLGRGPTTDMMECLGGGETGVPIRDLGSVGWFRRRGEGERLMGDGLA